MRLIGRRNFLEGLGLGAGAHLLGSMFRTMLPEALGQTPARKTFVVFTSGNGFVEKNYTCVARSATDFDLNGVFAPLAPFKSQVAIANKFYNPYDKALHGNQWATLSVLPSDNQTGEKRGPPGGISLDRFLAKEIGAKDPFPSTAIALGEGGKATKLLCVSADGKNQPFPAMSSSVKAYEAWFGAGIMPAAPGGPAPNTGALLAQDKSLLDFVAADITRMSARLAGPEKAKLDQYLASVRGVERQLKDLTMAQGNCTAPAKPGIELDRSGISPAVITANVDVTFAAIKCGLTRVAHISIMGFEAPFDGWGFLGSAGENWSHHQVMHAGDEPKYTKIANYIISKVAQMAESMSKVAVGNGTMLDDSLVAYVNTCGGKHHGGHGSHATVTVGKAGGALKTGIYQVYPEKLHAISDVYVSWVNAMGVPAKTFGDPMICKGPLPELMAA
jgi:hypothetical protein